MNNKIHHNSFFQTMAVCYGWLMWWTSPKLAKIESEEKAKRKIAKRQDRNLRKIVSRIQDFEKNGLEDFENREVLGDCGIALTTNYLPVFIEVQDDGEWIAECAYNYSTFLEKVEFVEIPASLQILKKIAGTVYFFKIESILRLKVKRLLFKLTPPSDWNNHVQFTRTLTIANSRQSLSISEGFSLPIFSRPPPVTHFLPLVEPPAIVR